MYTDVALNLFLLFAITCPCSTPEEVEQAFVKERSALISGRLTIQGEVETTVPRPFKEKWKRFFWFTPDRFRCEKITIGKQDSFRQIFCENCERDGYFVYFDERHLQPGSRTNPIVIQPLNLAKGWSDIKFDPRIIGISSQSLHAYYLLTLSNTIGRTDRTPPVLEKVRWKDRDAYQVSYKLKKTDALVRTTYVPDMGYSIVRSELDAIYNNPHMTFKRIMEAEPAKFGKTQVWFPRTVSMQRFINGNKVEQFFLEVTDAAFNEAIPAKTFKLIDMAIPAGAGIDLMYPEAQGYYFWDGQKIVQDKRPQVLRQDLPPPEANKGWQSWYFGLSISLATVGVSLVMVYYFRNQTRKT